MLTLMDADKVGTESEGGRLVEFPGRRRHHRHQTAHLGNVPIELVAPLLLRSVPHLPRRTAAIQTNNKSELATSFIIQTHFISFFSFNTLVQFDQSFCALLSLTTHWIKRWQSEPGDERFIATAPFHRNFIDGRTKFFAIWPAIHHWTKSTDH